MTYTLPTGIYRGMDRPLHPWLVWLRYQFGAHPDYEAVAARLKAKMAHTAKPGSLRLIAQGQRRPGWPLAFAIEALCRSKKITARKLVEWPHYVRQPQSAKRAA